MSLMSQVIQDLCDEVAAAVAAEAVVKATRQKEIELVSNLLCNGFSFEEAVELVEVSAIPVEELRKLVLPD